MSVRMSIRMYQRSSNWTDVHKVWYWGLLWKSVEKLQIKKNRTKISGTLPEDLSTFNFFYRGMKYIVAIQGCKEINWGMAMATLNGFILLTATCRSTRVQRNNFCDSIATMVTFRLRLPCSYLNRGINTVRLGFSLHTDTTPHHTSQTTP